MSLHDEPEQIDAGFLGWLRHVWKTRFPEHFRWNIEDSFQPEDIRERLLPGEEPQLEIRLAWYRDIFGRLVFRYFSWLVGLVLVITVILLLLAVIGRLSPFLALIPLVGLAVAVVLAASERIQYLQWRLLKTNARLIISIPQPGPFPLIDNIEFKNLPNVIDTNWSPNPLWRIFQFFTGARDLYISLIGYQFVEGRARVRDALIMPDIMPRDVFELRKLVFAVPKPPAPQKVSFVSPQEVIVTERKD